MVCLFLAGPIVGLAECPFCTHCAQKPVDIETEIQAIDQALEALNNQRLLYRARALWQSDKGTRLQNKKGFYLEARRAYKEADLDWEAVKMIEERMERLRERRAALVLRRQG